MTTQSNAPKVEQVRIDALVASLTYETAHVPNTTSTVATARLPGGFVVAIGHSACVAPENFDAELGRTYAIADAEQQSRKRLWELEGYALFLRMEQLRAAGVDGMPAHQQRVVLERMELAEKAEALESFINNNPLFLTLPECEREDMRDQLKHMRDYSDVLMQRICRFR